MSHLNNISSIINLIFALFAAFISISIIVRRCVNRFSKIREVNAEVIKKERYAETVIRMKRPTQVYRNVVTFMCSDKKRTFYVSEFSYDGYNVGECGILRYRADEIVDFELYHSEPR